MKRIDTTSLKPYYKEDNDAQIAKVGHVNAVIDAVSTNFKGELIDPTLNGGVSVYTQFAKDELVTPVDPVTGTAYDSYKVLVNSNLDDPSTTFYDIYIGTITFAPGTEVKVDGVKGEVLTDLPGFFGTLNFAGLFSLGATVLDVSGPGFDQLQAADVYGVVNPLDSKEYLLFLYAESFGSDFQCKVNVEARIAVTAGATIQYSRD